MATILVVDDEPVCNRLLPELLAEDGHQVRAAATANEAVRIGLAFKPDVLVADWRLHGERDGIDVARALLIARPDLRIIFMTGLPAAQLAARLNGLPVIRILEKPFEVAYLMAQIREAIAPTNHGPSDGGPADGRSPRG